MEGGFSRLSLETRKTSDTLSTNIPILSPLNPTIIILVSFVTPWLEIPSFSAKLMTGITTPRRSIDISEVHEINRFEHINRIPDLPDHVLGVIDLRGVVIPVINLAEKLGISSQGITKDTRIIIVGFNGDKIGILVDSVSEVLRVSNDSLEKPPSIIQRVNAEYICGIIRNNNQRIVVLDFLRLFKDYSPLQTREGLINLGEIAAPAQGNV